MVSSIIPGTAGANALGVDTRYARPQSQPMAQRRDEVQGDRVELSASGLSAARESVRAGLTQLHQALVTGQDAQSMLLQVQGLARSDGDGAQISALLSGYGKRVEGAIAGGAAILTGADIVVQADPGSTAVTIRGVDLRLKSEPGPDDVLQLGANTTSNDPALVQKSQQSLEALQAEMERLLEQTRSLESHQNVLGAAEGASSGIRHDLDADGARLMALQVRQGLAKAPADAIANVEPQAVLALFREA